MSGGMEHVHCDSCIHQKCSAIIDPICTVIACKLVCGAVFHACKSFEHRLLCPLETVPCINSGFGCPSVLRRCDLGKHLASCPASVVCCTMEWCRWPMYSRERGTRVPFAPSTVRARCGQLDVALALRDQRALDKAKRCPRRTLVRALRNSFTSRYPTVPLIVGGNPVFDDIELCNVTFSDSEDEDNEADSRAPWLTARDPPGLQKSILSELFCELPTKPVSPRNAFAVENVRCALCLKSTAVECTSNETQCQMATFETETNSMVCSKVNGKEDCTIPHHQVPENTSCVASRSGESVDRFGGTCAHTFAVPEAADTKFGESPQVEKNIVESLDGNCCSENYHTTSNSLESNNETDRNGSTNRDLDMNSFSSGEAIPGDMRETCEFDFCDTDISSASNTLAAPAYGRSGIKGRNRVWDVIHNVAAADSSKLELSCCSEEKGVPCAEHCALALHEVLSVNLNIEVCSRYHIHDPSLYSFACAQLFRRDEYTQHVRDVHAVIHDAVDHLLEVRCPLAHAGCTFSMHRRLPSKSNVIFSPLLESLGLRQTDVQDSMSEVHELLSHSSDYPPASREGNFTEDRKVDVSNMFACNSASAVAARAPSSTAATFPQDSNSVNSSHSGEPSSKGLSHSVVFYDYAACKECTPELFTSREFDSAVCMRPRASKEPTPCEDDSEVLHLTDLPFELLACIVAYLDPFSLCNLSLTCWLLREVCHSLLRRRGMVVLEWQKAPFSPRWTVSHLRWMFSTAFDSVEHWTFTDRPSMSEHLKVCPYNVVQQWDPSDRVALCQMTDTDADNWRAALLAQKNDKRHPSCYFCDYDHEEEADQDFY